MGQATSVLLQITMPELGAFLGYTKGVCLAAVAVLCQATSILADSLDTKGHFVPLPSRGPDRTTQVTLYGKEVSVSEDLVFGNGSPVWLDTWVDVNGDLVQKWQKWALDIGADEKERFIQAVLGEVAKVGDALFAEEGMEDFAVDKAATMASLLKLHSGLQTAIVSYMAERGRLMQGSSVKLLTDKTQRLGFSLKAIEGQLLVTFKMQVLEKDLDGVQAPVYRTICASVQISPEGLQSDAVKEAEIYFEERIPKDSVS
ncbi:MAG: hypothetical protein KDK78_07580 [Chlamydiia bacterium]|nr:hypothetical protein [Chlamydiia bacterium]